jgi:hypothetical protein
MPMTMRTANKIRELTQLCARGTGAVIVDMVFLLHLYATVQDADRQRLRRQNERFRATTARSADSTAEAGPTACRRRNPWQGQADR